MAHTPAEIASINLGHGAQPNKLIPLKRMLRAIILLALNFTYLNKRGRCAKRMLLVVPTTTKKSVAFSIKTISVKAKYFPEKINVSEIALVQFHE